MRCVFCFGLLVGLFAHWSIGQSVGWLVGWLVRCLFVWLVSGLVGLVWLPGWLLGWLAFGPVSARACEPVGPWAWNGPFFDVLSSRLGSKWEHERDIIAILGSFDVAPGSIAGLFL